MFWLLKTNNSNSDISQIFLILGDVWSKSQSPTQSYIITQGDLTIPQSRSKQHMYNVYVMLRYVCLYIKAPWYTYHFIYRKPGEARLGWSYFCLLVEWAVPGRDLSRLLLFWRGGATGLVFSPSQRESSTSLSLLARTEGRTWHDTDQVESRLHSFILIFYSQSFLPP